MNALRVDVALGASLKGLMLPPGLAFVSVNPKAMEASRATRAPRFFWAGGLGTLAGRAFRIGQSGDSDAPMVRGALADIGLNSRSRRFCLAAVVWAAPCNALLQVEPGCEPQLRGTGCVKAWCPMMPLARACAGRKAVMNPSAGSWCHRSMASARRSARFQSALRCARSAVISAIKASSSSISNGLGNERTRAPMVARPWRNS